jgi:hypothetical protein
MAVFICGLSSAYCCVFFLKKTRHRIAALFAVDTLVLAGLFLAGTAPAAAAAFILSAAAANITVLFIPEEEALPALTRADFAAIAGNVLVAAFAGLFVLKNPHPVSGWAGALNPALIAFLFMALTTAGYFIGIAASGGEK